MKSIRKDLFECLDKHGEQTMDDLVARVLGHKTLAMSLRYSHLAPDRVTELGDKLAARMGVAGGAK